MLITLRQGSPSNSIAHCMKHCASLLALLFLAITIVPIPSEAAKAPDWVKNAIEQAAAYTPDPNAPAVVIWKDNTVEIGKSGDTRQKVQWAIKVLKPNGVGESYLREHVSKRREVKKLKGWRIDPKGKVSELSKDNIVQSALDNAAGYYDDSHDLNAVLEDVGTGDVVAYEYEVRGKASFEGFYNSALFQVDLPVVYSRFEVTAPEGWEFFISENNMEGIEHVVDGSRHEWVARNLDYRPWEPLMPSWSYVWKRVQTGCYDPTGRSVKDFESWLRASQWACDRHETAAIPEEQVQTKALALTDGLATPWERFMVIADYVQHDIRYVAVELGDGRFEPRACNVTLANNYGDCKDKVTLMRAMLKAADIKSIPVLACSGSPVDPHFPSPSQFNHAIIAVPAEIVDPAADVSRAVVDEWLYFDPTDEGTPPGFLPGTLTGTWVLNVSKADSALTHLPKVDNSLRRRVYRANASLGADRAISADVRVVDYGLRAYGISHSRKQESVTETLSDWRDFFASTMPEPHITDLSMESDADSAWLDLHVTSPGYLDITGDMGLLKANLFHADRSNEKLSKERLHPVRFGNAGRWEYDITWTLPPTWRLSDPPPSDSTACETVTLIRKGELTESGVRMHTITDYSGLIEACESYKDARAFHQALRTTYEMRYLLLENEGN